MIYDKIENLKMYKDVIPNFTILEREINKVLNTPFTVGEVKTEDPNIFYICSEYMSENKLYEAHKDFFDVQIVLEGKERALIGECESPFEYDETNNIGNVKCTEISSLKLIPNYFALFSPNEMHSPGLPDKTTSKVRKVVFKIKNI